MIQIEEKNGILVARFKEGDRFNALIAEPVKETLLSRLGKEGTNMIMDLQGIKFIDSSGFGVFISAMKAAKNNAGEFKICNLNPEVKELFQILQLHHVFELYDTLEECIGSFQ